jgi:hypothetical protein
MSKYRGRERESRREEERQEERGREREREREKKRERWSASGIGDATSRAPCSHALGRPSANY